MSFRNVLVYLVLLGLMVGCSTATPTEAPSSASPPPPTEAADGGDFIDHAFLPPESQVIFQEGEFQPLELAPILMTGFGEAEQIEWQVGATEHLALEIEDGQLVAEPLDPDWIGQESIELTACNMQEEYCTRGQVDYGVLDPDVPTIIHVQNDGYLIMVGGKKILKDIKTF